MKTKISLMMLLLAAWLLVGCEGQNEPTSEGGGSVESTEIASVNKKINYYGTIYEVILKDGNRMYFAIKNDKEVRMGCWSYFYDGSEYEYEKYAAYEYKGHLVIPEKITLEGKEYLVTELYNMSASSYSLSNMEITRLERPNTTLLSVVIPKTINKMKDGCFSFCTALKSVTFVNDSPIRELSKTFVGCASLKEVILPQNLSSVGANRGETFALCTSLKTINLPETVTEIGYRAFIGCNSLEDINLENVKVVGEDVWGSSAFEGCTSLKTANLESAIKIHKRTFSGCTSLKTVNLESAKKIYEHTFSGCTSLENVKLDNLEVLGREAFDSCTALQKVELPSIKYLGIDVEEDEENIWWDGDAFVDCHALETLILGSSLINTNGGRLFEGCENLKDVYCYAINPPMLDGWEEGASDNRVFIGDFVLHVPATSIEAYRETYWGKIYRFMEGSVDSYESVVGYRTIVAIEE